MVVSFTNTYVISANHHCSCEFESNGEVCSIQHYVIMFVSNLQQVGGFPPLIKLTAENHRPAGSYWQTWSSTPRQFQQYFI
jgi:hypothetical protein